jgi:ribonuclease E
VETAAVDTAAVSTREPTTADVTAQAAGIPAEVTAAMVSEDDTAASEMTTAAEIVEAVETVPVTEMETAAEAPAPEPEVQVAVAEAAPIQDVKPAEPARKAPGVTESGRAWNDPRIEPKPVAEVVVQTSYPTLFGADIAPPASQTRMPGPRAANDPRGPLTEDSMTAPVAESAGQ